jgi:hypothetical protein
MDTRERERPRNSALSEYAPLSGILIFAALMCLCIILLANEVKRSAAILAPMAFGKIPVATAQPEAREATSSSSIGQTGRLPIAPALASSQSSGEGSVMAELRKSSANLDRISDSPLLGASRCRKMGKVALWQPRGSRPRPGRSLRASRLSLRQFVGRAHAIEALASTAARQHPTEDHWFSW